MRWYRWDPRTPGEKDADLARALWVLLFWVLFILIVGGLLTAAFGIK